MFAGLLLGAWLDYQMDLPGPGVWKVRAPLGQSLCMKLLVA